MAIKALIKKTDNQIAQKADEKKLNQFISKGGSVTSDESDFSEDDHRLTLRIPKYLMEKVDKKRRKRVGKISRNLWILEVIERATQKM